MIHSSLNKIYIHLIQIYVHLQSYSQSFVLQIAGKKKKKKQVF